MAKSALITGASSDIGEEPASSLLATDYIVHIGARLVALDVTNDASTSPAIVAIVRDNECTDALMSLR